MFRLLDKCRIDEKIALLYQIIAMSFTQLSYTLYPRIMPITDLLSQGNEIPWGYVDETSNRIVKPQIIGCKYLKQFSSEVLLIDDSQYLTVMVGF